ncbi:unnamed protein product [Mortierella alpina]
MPFNGPRCPSPLQNARTLFELILQSCSAPASAVASIVRTSKRSSTGTKMQETNNICLEDSLGVFAQSAVHSTGITAVCPVDDHSQPCSPRRHTNQFQREPSQPKQLLVRLYETMMHMGC